MNSRIWIPLLAVLLGPLACCESASSRSPLTALLRIAGAQLVLGTPPDDEGGPAVQSVRIVQSQVWPSQQDKPLEGTLQLGASAVSLHLVGDPVHYIAPAGAPDLTAPELPTFGTRLSFSPWLPLGSHTLRIQATDEEGHYGPASEQSLVAVEEPPPEGALVISLRWERAADLDLHVEEPSGQEIWARRKSGNRSPAPGRPPSDPDAGYLDRDSNSLCVIDGRQQEDVIYRRVAASGRYQIRVDTFSLCGQPTAYWQIAVWSLGKRVAQASGQSLPALTRGEHGQGAGTVAIELKIP